MSNVRVGEIKFEPSIGIEEVVSIFVSKYETKLLDKKKVLSDKVKQLKEDLFRLNGTVKKEVDESQYTSADLGLFNINVVCEKIIFWNDEYSIIHGHTYPNRVELKVRLYKNGECCGLTVVEQTFPIKEELVDQYTKLAEEIFESEDQLLSVTADIKNVGRKQRQIRSKLAEMKLQEQGLTDLINNTELLQLIEVK